MPSAHLYTVCVTRIQPMALLLLAGAAVAQAKPANQVTFAHTPLVVDAHY